MSKPVVSITIISYNQVEYLSDCLESVLSQDYDPLEIVVSDDASIDGSQAVLMDYSARFPGIIIPILNQKNLGLAGNRDRAISACSGEFIAWLDADDLAHPTRISKQVHFMIEHPECSISYHDMQVIRETQPTDQTIYHVDRPALEGDHTILLQNENFIISSSVMIRARFLPRKGYNFHTGPTFSDYHFLTRMARLGRIGYLNEVLGGYRRHEKAATNKSSKVRSGVRKRRALALEAMYQEFKEDRTLLRYCLARFHLSQLSGALRGRDPSVLTHSAMRLICLFPQTIDAFLDRRRNTHLLPSLDF